MRFQRLLIIGSASLLGLFLFLILMLAVLAFSHDRWLPAFTNQYLLSEPVAGLPANSLHLDAIELESWQRLRQLTLSGPNNSQLQIQGVSWPFSGNLIIDRLSIRLPDQLPERLPASQSSDESGIRAPDPAAPIENPAKAEPTQTATELLLNQELSVKKAYGEYLNQADSLLAQLESFRKQYQLQTLTIRSLDLQGMPLKHTVSAKHFSGDPGHQNGQPHWQLNVSSREVEGVDNANLDIRLRLSPQDHQLSMALKQLDRLSPDTFKLPVWIPVKASLDSLKKLSPQNSLSLANYDTKIALQLRAHKADLAVSLPAFSFKSPQGCQFAIKPRTLSLGYRIGDSGSEQLRFNPGKELTQDLSGSCITALLNLPQDSDLHPWVKGLDQATLRKGGKLKLKLNDAISADLTAKALNLSGFELSWQPADLSSVALELALSQIRLTPDTLFFNLESKLKTELKPQPVFANQSRQFALSTHMTSDIKWDLETYLSANQRPGSNLQWLRNIQLDVQNSEMTLLPAPNDDAVLWAPSRLEIPLLQHEGRWAIKLHQPMSEAGDWQLSHKGQGEVFVRYPGMKHNTRLPFQADADLTGRLQGLNIEKVVQSMTGHFNGRLTDAPARTNASARAPIDLLPVFSVNTRINADQIQSEIRSEIDLASLSEWTNPAAETLITDGRVTLQSVSLLDKTALAPPSTRATPKAADNRSKPLLNQLRVSLTANLMSLAGETKGYTFSGVHLPLQLELAQGQLNLEPTRLSIHHAFAGVELTTLKADLKVRADLTGNTPAISGQLNNFSASTLGGHIELAELSYPFPKKQPSDLILKDLDLSQLIALSEKQVKVTGQLNGRLPIILSHKGIVINKGQLRSYQGEIILKDNPAWQAMLQQQPTLASQLKHLNQLHFDLLQGDINMKENGQLTAVLKIRGENRAESQPVNLNFTSEQNILTLLKALRLSDKIDKSLSESAQRTYP